jgi:hypothetical protein
MTGKTRRLFLQGFAGLALPLTTRVTSAGTNSDDNHPLKVRDLVVRNIDVPDRFEQYDETGSGRFVERLYARAPALTTADTATTCYWYGGDQDDPRWVLSSLALVADDPLPRNTVEGVIGESTKAYVEAYDDETNPFVEFETEQASDTRTSNWRVDIIDTSGVHGPTDGKNLLYSDLM